MATGKKLWGGRFNQPTDKLVEAFTASIPFDKRLYSMTLMEASLTGKMLVKQGIIPLKDGKKITAGLNDIRLDIEKGKFDFRLEDEDIHMAIEKALVNRIGEAGERLHTGRSRNDQVALDIRLYLRKKKENSSPSFGG